MRPNQVCCFLPSAIHTTPFFHTNSNTSDANTDAGSRPSVSVGRRLSYFKWDKYTPDPSFWSPPTTAKKKKPFGTQSARPFVSKLSFTETPLSEDPAPSASASARAPAHAHAVSGLPPPQASAFRRRPPAETTGIPLPPTSKRPRTGAAQSASLRAPSAPAPAFSASQRASTASAISSAAAAAVGTATSSGGSAQGTTTTAGLLQLVSNQSDRIEKLSRELEREREARLALERRFLELRSKLTLAHII